MGLRRRGSAALALLCTATGSAVLAGTALDSLPAGRLLLAVRAVSALIARTALGRRGAARTTRLALALGLLAAAVVALWEEVWIPATLGVALVLLGLRAGHAHLDHPPHVLPPPGMARLVERRRSLVELGQHLGRSLVGHQAWRVAGLPVEVGHDDVGRVPARQLDRPERG